VCALRALEKSPALSARLAFESSSVMRAMRALEKSPVLSARRTLEKSRAMRAIRAPEESSALNAKRAFESSSFMSVMRALEDSSRFASFNELAEKLSSRIVGPLTLSEAYQVVAQSFEQTSDSTDIGRMEKLSSQVERQVNEAPKGPLSKEFYLSLILAFFLFWLSQVSSTDSEIRLLSRIDQFEATISQQLTELKAYEEVNTFYIVMRPVDLHVRPNTRSDIITVLYPNMKVKLIRRASKWIRIEYFDYRENVHISGWVYKKYLKILNPNRPR